MRVAIIILLLLLALALLSYRNRSRHTGHAADMHAAASYVEAVM